MEKSKTNSDALILSAGEGRKYNCGMMTAVFKADESETNELLTKKVKHFINL